MYRNEHWLFDRNSDHYCYSSRCGGAVGAIGGLEVQTVSFFSVDRDIAARASIVGTAEIAGLFSLCLQCMVSSESRSLLQSALGSFIVGLGFGLAMAIPALSAAAATLGTWTLGADSPERLRGVATAGAAGGSSLLVGLAVLMLACSCFGLGLSTMFERVAEVFDGAPPRRNQREMADLAAMHAIAVRMGTGAHAVQPGAAAPRAAAEGAAAPVRAPVREEAQAVQPVAAASRAATEGAASSRAPERDAATFYNDTVAAARGQQEAAKDSANAV